MFAANVAPDAVTERALNVPGEIGQAKKSVNIEPEGSAKEGVVIDVPVPDVVSDPVPIVGRSNCSPAALENAHDHVAMPGATPATADDVSDGMAEPS